MWKKIAVGLPRVQLLQFEQALHEMGHIRVTLADTANFYKQYNVPCSTSYVYTTSICDPPYNAKWWPPVPCLEEARSHMVEVINGARPRCIDNNLFDLPLGVEVF